MCAIPNSRFRSSCRIMAAKALVFKLRIKKSRKCVYSLTRALKANAKCLIGFAKTSGGKHLYALCWIDKSFLFCLQTLLKNTFYSTLKLYLYRTKFKTGLNLKTIALAVIIFL